MAVNRKNVGACVVSDGHVNLVSRGSIGHPERPRQVEAHAQRAEGADESLILSPLKRLRADGPKTATEMQLIDASHQAGADREREGERLDGTTELDRTEYLSTSHLPFRVY